MTECHNMLWKRKKTEIQSELFWVFFLAVSDIFCQFLIAFDRYLLKGAIFLKNRHFIIQERFGELIYGINTIIKCDI